MTVLVIVEMLPALVFVTNVHKENPGYSVVACFQESSKTRTVVATACAEVAPNVAAAVLRKNLPLRKLLATVIAVVVINAIRNRLFTKTHRAAAASADSADKGLQSRKCLVMEAAAVVVISVLSEEVVPESTDLAKAFLVDQRLG